MRRTAAAALVGVALAAAAVAPAATAATIAVTTTADIVGADGACGLREAVTAANLDVAVPGAGECAAGSPAQADRILLGPGVYALTRPGVGDDANATGDLDLRGAVALVGAGAGATSIDARGTDRAVWVAAGATVTIEGLTITGGSAPAGATAGAPGATGGGVLNEGALTLVGARISGNAGGAGGAGADAVGGVEANGVAGASVAAGPGGPGGAGGIASDGPLTLIDTVVVGNRGGPGGPGGAAVGGSAGAGPLGADGGDARGGDGGDGGGGGIVVADSATVVRGAILDNRSGPGGRGGDARGGAGAGGGDGGSGGDATGGVGGDGGDGAGLLTDGALSLRESAVAANLAGAGGQGGGASGGARSGLANVLGAGVGGPGGAGGDGGGIAAVAGSADLFNATVAANLTGPGGAGGAGGAGIPGGGPGSAGGAGGPGGAGGGVAAGASLAVAFVTIAGNGEAGAGTTGRAGDVSAPGAPGAAGAPGAGASAGVRADGPLALTRSIAAGNGCAGAAFPAAADPGGVAFGSPGCPGDGGDPGLGPLGANGGTTPAMRPAPGGAAIDRVPAGACPTTDQRGARRPAGAACDAGALEFAPPGAATGGPLRIGEGDADVAATVDTRGLATEYYVDFGPTPAYGGRTAGVAIPGAAAPTGIGATLTGLAAGTAYHYRVVAVGPDGVSAGADRTLQTASAPTAAPAAVMSRPRVTRLAVAPRAFAVLPARARRTAATRTRPARGARVTIRLSSRATVVLTVRRATPGRRVRSRGVTRCLPVRGKATLRRAARCTRYPVVGTLRRRAAAGISRFTFTGRLRVTPLRRGSYRLEARALDSLRRPSAPVRTGFRVVRWAKVSRAR